MIARMAKVEILGPKELTLSVLTRLREWGRVQIASRPPAEIAPRAGPPPQAYGSDRESLGRRFALEELRDKIRALLDLLSPRLVRPCYLDPAEALPYLTPLVDKHLARCRALHQQRDEGVQLQRKLQRAAAFLEELSPLVEHLPAESDLDMIGLEFRDPTLCEALNRNLHRLTDGRYDLQTRRTDDGTIVGLITTEKGLAQRIRRGLEAVQLPEMPLPEFLDQLPLPERLAALSTHRTDLDRQLATIAQELAQFEQRWAPLYHRVLGWLDEQLALLQLTLEMSETDLCFVLDGWVPARDCRALEALLQREFGGRVVLEEKEIREEELEQIPVTLQNPAYVRPFELLVRLLPLPQYGTIDPTPLLAIFFPLFFGLILGDIGYGLILGAAAGGLVFWGRRPMLVDAGKILGVCAFYTILFGGLYGELFGSLGHKLFGLHPVWIARETAIVPMLLFALAVGLVHVVMGLVLGCINASRQGERKEAWFRGLSALALVGTAALAVSFMLPWSDAVRRVLLTGLAVTVPLLVIFGGLLAPLEMLQSLGNVISYVRLAAVGLTSVLLAEVANRLAGLAGSLWLGILVALLLHGFNLLLGVFAPTVHALRLHYVEFFGKFLAPGGRQFAPLHKAGAPPEPRRKEKDDGRIDRSG